MRKKTNSIYTYFCAFLFIAVPYISCSPSNKIKPPQINQEEWTLLPLPNNLDSVGTIFSIDKKKDLVRIPVNIPVKTKASLTAITQKTKTQTLNLDQIIKFGKINFDDSIAKINIGYNKDLDYEFSINKPLYTVLDENLHEPFMQKSKEIIQNIKLFDLKENNIYVVFETISSNSVNIKLSNNSSSNLDVFGNIKSQIILNSKNKLTSETKNSFTFNYNESLIVLYKLRKVNINISKVKGTEEYFIDVSLGEIVTNLDLLKN